MEIRKVVIREELIKSFRELEGVIQAVNDEALGMGIHPSKLRDTSGGFVLAPLIVAKVQILHSFALLQEKKGT